MKWALQIVSVAVVCAAMAGCVNDQRSVATGSLAITSVDIIDVESGEVLKDRTILLDADRILDVLPAERFEPAPDVRLIDGRGKYAIPGLWDMHVHVVSADPPVSWDLYDPKPQ